LRVAGWLITASAAGRQDAPKDMWTAGACPAIGAQGDG
jgi:hypothetical protein